jgi:hypothetical protein
LTSILGSVTRGVRGVTLAQQLQAAAQREEILKLDAGDQRVAADLARRIQPLPANELSVDIRTRLDAFNKWAIARQARRCPAKPATVALWALEQAAMGVPAQQILAQLDAIERLHDRWGLANPVRTAIVRPRPGGDYQGSSAKVLAVCRQGPVRRVAARYS